ncbi:hypothetical protein BPTFM16_00806 [Altererythrobacter insulae]|nr:hypothetical protein BPTFM16_00806 [Altererythrobacter insulae]
MTYDPKAPDRDDRDYQLKLWWIGLPASWINLVILYLLQDPEGSANLFGVFAASLMATMVFAYRFDEFFEAHLWRASRWALSAAGLLMLFGIFPILEKFNLTDELGANMCLAIVATVFHTTLAISRWKK